ncbi:hypothetical protein FJZ33_12255 [Candidatus Poribacteria bacterium]|nr:hypothetical protein [Candidatus Poribacteria bacterium]
MVGHLTVDLKEFGTASKSEIIKNLSSIFYYLLPNLENFNIRAEMVRDININSQFILYAIGYGILYIATMLLISILSMEKKEFM